MRQSKILNMVNIRRKEPKMPEGTKVEKVISPNSGDATKGYIEPPARVTPPTPKPPPAPPRPPEPKKADK